MFDSGQLTLLSIFNIFSMFSLHSIYENINNQAKLRIFRNYRFMNISSGFIYVPKYVLMAFKRGKRTKTKICVLAEKMEMN